MIKPVPSRSATSNSSRQTLENMSIQSEYSHIFAPVGSDVQFFLHRCMYIPTFVTEYIRHNFASFAAGDCPVYMIEQAFKVAVDAASDPTNGAKLEGRNQAYNVYRRQKILDTVSTIRASITCVLLLIVQ